MVETNGRRIKLLRRKEDETIVDERNVFRERALQAEAKLRVAQTELHRQQAALDRASDAAYLNDALQSEEQLKAALSTATARCEAFTVKAACSLQTGDPWHAVETLKAWLAAEPEPKGE